MLAALRDQTAPRRFLAVLALLALGLRLLVPAGFMPGTSLAAPIVLCAGEGAMPGMAMPADEARPAAGGRHHAGGDPHGGMPHGRPDHPCAFAGVGTAALAAALDAPAPVAAPAAQPAAASAPHAAPGRGMAAPPPPSHAPPALRA